MNDQERLSKLKEALASVHGVDAATYERLMRQIGQSSQPFGYDPDGKLRVAFFDAKSYDRASFDQTASDRVAWQYIPASLTRDTTGAAENCKVVCIFVNDSCDESVVEALKSQGVEMIALRCAGFNNVDLDACQRHSVSVTRVPAYSPYAVAEHSVALMLMLNRKLHQAYVRNRAGYFLLDGLTGFDMRGKVVGVVGTGTIGKCLADILLGFGCRVIAYDKHPNPDLVDRSGVTYHDMKNLLAESDIISLHVPLVPDTRYLIDDEAIAKMKSGAMLINTSRGGLVDSKALIRGLKSGKIGAAGLDVYEEEAGIFFHDRSTEILTDDVLARLMTFSNVVITSHQAFLTHEALSGIASTTLSNIHEFLDGRRGGELTNSVSATS
ncbi:D-lactate dehydrogenase [Stieleria maiorica]|uniref:D-lactate dehydrogenase n=1 Tax=Stieleria maiorica TaxID=2795974 RepID=A0A5B9MK65_9BACT|nr:2-hydroxyacid dehydrogenase [Stieleria maiorica]QEG00026.1 D-lactate dehydrogenase [Stieleria maiorica]